jgi:hypothetical protein
VAIDFGPGVEIDLLFWVEINSEPEVATSSAPAVVTGSVIVVAILVGFV